jgi:uncharacterized membrane protein
MINTDDVILGGTVLVLVLGILLFSLSFETPYNKDLRYLARQPFFRFAAFLLILIGMDWNPVVGMLTFLSIVLWFYDVQLLSA